MKIGPYFLPTQLLLAPMAGITDLPFRRLCRRFGAGLTVAEMVSCNPSLYASVKTRLRLDHSGEPAPRVVQILGADPEQMADAARYHADRGADIIDINMGCPARKVCSARAGSALLDDERLVGRILAGVVGAVTLPVTLKLRTGSDPGHRNAPRIARIAEQAGIQALTVHGRTRSCAYQVAAEHETTRTIKRQVSIPVIANGDIRTPQDAARVLAQTGADAVMIGRAARGNPWLLRATAHYLASGVLLPEPEPRDVYRILIDQLRELHRLYGASRGVRIARKHIGWYLERLPGSRPLLAVLNRVQCATRQLQLLQFAMDDPRWLPRVA